MIKIEIFTPDCPMASGDTFTTEKLSVHSEVFRITFLVCQCEACRKLLGPEKAKGNTINCDLVAITKDDIQHMIDTWVD